jgi:hypothetical protein
MYFSPSLFILALTLITAQEACPEWPCRDSQIAGTRKAARDLTGVLRPGASRDLPEVLSLAALRKIGSGKEGRGERRGDGPFPSAGGRKAAKPAGGASGGSS